MIRSTQPSDFQAVYDIYMDETVNPFMHHEVLPQDKFVDIFEDFMQRDYSWVYTHDNKVVGMASAIAGIARTAHNIKIATLGISQSYQGQGLGKQMLIQIIETLRNDGFKRIELTVESDNKKAIPFYQKMGFTIEGNLKGLMKRKDDNHYVDNIYMAITYL